MNGRDLKYFSAIAQTGSLREASEQLYISQPALTKCIARLEEQLDTKLFEKKGRQLVLTPAGHVLVKRSKQILQNILEMQKEVSSFSKGEAGHIRIGAAATITEFLLPNIINEMTQLTPEVTMDLTVGMGDVLSEALRKDELDLIITPTIESSDFLVKKIVEDQVVIVASRQHPLANKISTLEDLKHYEWVLSGHHVATRTWLEQTFSHLGLPLPRVKVEANSLAVLPPLIAKTNLLTFISRRNLSKPGIKEYVVEIPFKETTLHRHFSVHTRKESYLSPASERFIQLLIQRGATLYRA